MQKCCSTCAASLTSTLTGLQECSRTYGQRCDSVEGIFNTVQSYFRLLVHIARQLLGSIGCLSNRTANAVLLQGSKSLFDSLQVLILGLLEHWVVLVVEAEYAVGCPINLKIGETISREYNPCRRL